LSELRLQISLPGKPGVAIALQDGIQICCLQEKSITDKLINNKSRNGRLDVVFMELAQRVKGALGYEG